MPEPKAAEQEDPDSQYHLAHCYLDGTGVPKNLTEAIKWAKKAAEQGNSGAQKALKSIIP